MLTSTRNFFFQIFSCCSCLFPHSHSQHAIQYERNNKKNCRTAGRFTVKYFSLVSSVFRNRLIGIRHKTKGSCNGWIVARHRAWARRMEAASPQSAAIHSQANHPTTVAQSLSRPAQMGTHNATREIYIYGAPCVRACCESIEFYLFIARPLCLLLRLCVCDSVWLVPFLYRHPAAAGPDDSTNHERNAGYCFVSFSSLYLIFFLLVPLLCCFIRLLSMRVQIASQTHTHTYWYSMYSRMFYTRLMWIVLSCYNIVYRRKKEEEETKLASQKQRLAMTKRTLSRHAHRQECTSHHHHHRPSSSSSLSYRTFFLAQQNKKYSIRERVYRPLQRFLNLDRNLFADNTDTGQFNGRPPHRICYDKSSPCDRDILKYSQIEL